jgi:hypothetical protein
VPSRPRRLVIGIVVLRPRRDFFVVVGCIRRVVGVAFGLALLVFVLVRIGFGYDARVFRSARLRIPAVALAGRMKTNCIQAVSDPLIVIAPATRRRPNGIALREVGFLRRLVRTN